MGSLWRFDGSQMRECCGTRHTTLIGDDDLVVGIGAKTTADTLYSKGRQSMGLDGSKYAVVALDLGTNWSDFFPCAEKSSTDARQALLQFAGQERIESFYSDNARELAKAVVDLGCRRVSRRAR